MLQSYRTIKHSRNKIGGSNRKIGYITIEIDKEKISNRFTITKRRSFIIVTDEMYNREYRIFKSSTNYFVFYGISVVFILNRDSEIITDLSKLDEELKSAINRSFFTKNVHEESKDYKIHRFKKKKLLEYSDCEDLNLKNAWIKLEELNQKLKMKCPNLSLKLDKLKNLSGEFAFLQDYMFNQEFTTLCLYDDDDCVSSILISQINDDTIEINSDTHLDKSNKKYNKLLRSVVIICLPLIKCNKYNIRVLYSIAANPISAWLLIGYYDIVTPPKFNRFFIRNMSDDKTESVTQITQRMINSYIVLRRRLPLRLVLTQNNLALAKEMFDKLTSDIGMLRC